MTIFDWYTSFIWQSGICIATFFIWCATIIFLNQIATVTSTVAISPPTIVLCIIQNFLWLSESECQICCLEFQKCCHLFDDCGWIKCIDGISDDPCKPLPHLIEQSESDCETSNHPPPVIELLNFVKFMSLFYLPMLPREHPPIFLWLNLMIDWITL